MGALVVLICEDPPVREMLCSLTVWVWLWCRRWRRGLSHGLCHFCFMICVLQFLLVQEKFFDKFGHCWFPGQCYVLLPTVGRGCLIKIYTLVE